MRSRRRAFYDCDAFPELETIRTRWPVILEEARRTFEVLDEKMIGNSYVLPLVPEAEDRHEIASPIWGAARELSPTTTAQLTSIPYVVAFAYSKLEAGKHIAEHEHWNPYLVAILCLDNGGSSYLVAGGERRDYHDGEMLLFDYTLPHEAKNEGDHDRLVLLIIIDPRIARRLKQ